MQRTEFKRFRLLRVTCAALCWLAAAPSFAGQRSDEITGKFRALFQHLSFAGRAPSQGCNSAEQVSQGIARRIDQIVRQEIKKKGINNAEVVVGTSSGVLYKNQYGVSADTQYDLASVSKPLATSTAIMKLAEKGLLQVNQPVGDFLPEFRSIQGPEGKPITIDDLLRHRGSIAELDSRSASKWKDKARNEAFSTATHLIAENTRRHKSQLSPFVYRDSNYFLLSQVIRVVVAQKIEHRKTPTGYEYEEFVQAEVLKPLGMSARIGNPHGLKQLPEASDGLAHSLFDASGNAGLFANSNDLRLYAEAMLNKKFLSEASIKALSTARPEDAADYTRRKNFYERIGEPVPALHGAGFDADPESFKAAGMSSEAYGHTGSYGTSILIDPKRNLYVIVLAQKNRNDNKAMGKFRKAISEQALQLRNARNAAQIQLTDCDPVNDVAVKSRSMDTPASPSAGIFRAVSGARGQQ